MTSNKKNICFYHDRCSDGFAASWVLNKFLGEFGVDYIPANYGMEIDFESLRGKMVYAVDFSFSNEVINQICDVANHLLIIDHHKSFEDQKPWPQRSNLKIVFDKAKSGALLTLDHFSNEFKDAPIKVSPTAEAVVKYVSDRDLWKFSLFESRSVNAALQSIPFNFSDWDNLVLGDLIKEGKGIDRFIQQQVDIIVETCTQKCVLNISDEEEVEGLSCNTARIFASDVATKLAEKSGTFGATYFVEADGSYVWSLRSIGDYDTIPIARYYGGGGHKNATGFVIKPNWG